MNEESFNYTISDAEKLKALQSIAEALGKLASCVKQGKNGKPYFDTRDGYED